MLEEFLYLVAQPSQKTQIPCQNKQHKNQTVHLQNIPVGGLFFLQTCRHLPTTYGFCDILWRKNIVLRGKLCYN